jgi:hypothetical protein
MWMAFGAARMSTLYTLAAAFLGCSVPQLELHGP